MNLKSSYRFPYCLKDYLNPRHYYGYLKGFWQRGTRGFAYSDLWSLDHYMAEILVNTLPTYQNRHPDCHTYYLLDKDEHMLLEGKWTDEDMKRAEDEWDAMIDNIIKVLYDAYLNPDTAYYGGHDYEKIQGVMFDFAKYFGHFWN